MANRLYNKQVTPKGYKAGGMARRMGKKKPVLSEEGKRKIKMFFEQFQQLPSWFTNLWILVVASIYGIKGTQIFRNGKK